MSVAPQRDLHQRSTVAIRQGAAAVDDLAPQLHDLYDATTDIGVTGTWPWISASVPDRDVHTRPWLVTVQRNTVVAAAVLVDDVSGAVRRTTLAGTAEHHRGFLAATDPEAARALGAALADALLDEVREFTLGPVRPGPAVDALLDRLALTPTVDDVEIPAVRLTGDPASAMSAGTRRTLRKSANRLTADGVEARTDVVGTAGEILAMLPLLESISRDRDHASGRSSPLDVASGRRVWQRRVRALASRGLLRLATLWLDDDLAAYVLGVDDGDTYRVLEGRFVSSWARYSPGRLLEAAVLDAAASRPACLTFDWMTDIAPESLLAANDAQRLVVVRGRT